MRKALVVLIFLAVPLAAEEKPKATLADMSWLTGHWTGTALGGFVEEIWSEPRGGAMMGMFTGLFFIYGVKALYPLMVGGQPIFPVPQGIIITFELTMLGLMGLSFIGMFVDSGFPSYTPKAYTPEISDGKIAVLFSCPTGEKEKFIDTLKEAGAESVEPAEARHL